MRTGMQQTNPMVKMTPATHKKGNSTQTHPTSVARPAGEPLACWMPADMVFPTPDEIADTPSIMLAKIDVLGPASCSPIAPALICGAGGQWGPRGGKATNCGGLIQQLAPPSRQSSRVSSPEPSWVLSSLIKIFGNVPFVEMSARSKGEKPYVQYVSTVL